MARWPQTSYLEPHPHPPRACMQASPHHWVDYRTFLGSGHFRAARVVKKPSVISDLTNSALHAGMSTAGAPPVAVPTLLIDDLLVRIHFIIVMIRWTGLAPWEFEFPFPMQACRRLGLPQWPFQHSGPRKRKAPSGILVDLSYPATYGVTSGPP